MERCGGRGRGGRRGSGNRWRGGERTHSQAPDGDAHRGGGGRRGGGGGHRNRSWRGGAPRGGRGGPPPPDMGRVGQDDPDTVEEEEESGGYGFSRRKLVSNWDRYEAAEKKAATESVEVQKGADYNVLLSSAGDSFAQFRFADEKEWDVEQSGLKQLSALPLDCDALVLALQELPLYLRLNLEASLVQEETPLDIPQAKPRAKEENKITGPKFGIPLHVGGKVPFADTIVDDVAHKVPSSSSGGPAGPSQAAITIPSIPQHEAETFESELDLLLSLEDSVIEENTTRIKTELSNPTVERTMKMDFGHVEGISITPPVPPQAEEISASKEQPAETPKVTEEDLEDWLDSMIS